MCMCLPMLLFCISPNQIYEFALMGVWLRLHQSLSLCPFGWCSTVCHFHSKWLEEKKHNTILESLIKRPISPRLPYQDRDVILQTKWCFYPRLSDDDKICVTVDWIPLHRCDKIAWLWCCAVRSSPEDWTMRLRWGGLCSASLV